MTLYQPPHPAALQPGGGVKKSSNKHLHLQGPCIGMTAGTAAAGKPARHTCDESGSLWKKEALLQLHKEPLVCKDPSLYASHCQLDGGGEKGRREEKRGRLSTPALCFDTKKSANGHDKWQPSLSWPLLELQQQLDFLCQSTPGQTWLDNEPNNRRTVTLPTDIQGNVEVRLDQICVEVDKVATTEVFTDVREKEEGEVCKETDSYSRDVAAWSSLGCDNLMTMADNDSAVHQPPTSSIDAEQQGITDDVVPNGQEQNGASDSIRDSELKTDDTTCQLNDVTGNEGQGQGSSPDSNPVTSTGITATTVGGGGNTNSDGQLPDILDAHRPPVLPPYTPPQSLCSGPGGLHGNNLYPTWGFGGGEGRGQAPPPPPTVTTEDTCCTKDCCLGCLTTVTTFRWILVALAGLGICCVVSGIVLGVLHISDNSSGFLTLSLMFIGLGIMMVIVVIIGWRCTPGGHEPCHLLLSLGEHSRQDDGHYYSSSRAPWHAGMLYPEFRYRRPPPSYNAAVMHQQPSAAAAARRQAILQQITPLGARPPSPPPAYRSRQSTLRSARGTSLPRLLTNLSNSLPSSRPPTYRSHASSRRDGGGYGRSPLPFDLTAAAVTSSSTTDVAAGCYDNAACDEPAMTVISATTLTQTDQCSTDLIDSRDFTIDAAKATSSASHISPVERVVQYLESLLQAPPDCIPPPPPHPHHCDSSEQLKESHIYNETLNSVSEVALPSTTLEMPSSLSPDTRKSAHASLATSQSAAQIDDTATTTDRTVATVLRTTGGVSGVKDTGNGSVTYVIQIQLPHTLNSTPSSPHHAAVDAEVVTSL